MNDAIDVKHAEIMNQRTQLPRKISGNSNLFFTFKVTRTNNFRNSGDEEE